MNVNATVPKEEYGFKVNRACYSLIYLIAMKIQKVPRHDMNAAVFSVNETEYSVKEGWASISIPSKTFGGKGKL